jgi:hypothetical protein
MRHVFDVPDQWLSKIRKITRLCEPVIHLQIDIGSVVTSPWWTDIIVPDALQIGW